LKKRLGKFEFQIMKMMWSRDKASVRDVWEKFYPERKLAYTTIATLMKKLEEKGFLRHEEVDRTYIYYPVVSQDNVSHGMLKDITDSFFNGSTADLVSMLIQNENLSEKELDKIQQNIDEYRMNIERGTKDD